MNIEQFILRDDGGFPNSRLPVLLYKGVFDVQELFPVISLKKMFEKNGWSNCWDAGIFEFHHYHSLTHEVLGVYNGQTKLQLGGPRGPKIFIEKGDVLIIPAGVAHKNLGSEHSVDVVGAYPLGKDADMNFGKPGERPGTDENIKDVPLPPADPVGVTEGLTKYWQEGNRILEV